MIEPAPADRFPEIDDAMTQLKPATGPGPGDPLTTQMVALAKSGPPRAEFPPTPTSPVPRGRTPAIAPAGPVPGPPPPAPTGENQPGRTSRPMVGFGIGLIAAVAILGTWLVGRPTTFEEVAPVISSGWILLGSHHPGAAVAINGAAPRPIGPAPRWWMVPVGKVDIEVRAEGCQAWHEARTIGAGDSVQIGYREPSCPGGAGPKPATR
jgi:hypothetical protein